MHTRGRWLIFLALLVLATVRSDPASSLVSSSGGILRPQTLGLDYAIPAGLHPTLTEVHKYGRTNNIDNGVATDIWDGASRGVPILIWVAPTQARTHAIVSTDANDDGDPVGTGAHTIRVYGLTSWTTPEVSEDITLNGVGAVNTVNDYVCLHRMQVLTKGASGPNVGIITATAATDGTITAQISAGVGQTEMAIYCIPSGTTAYMTMFGFGANAATAAATRLTSTLLYNPDPANELTAFLRKGTLPIPADGVPTFRPYPVWRPFTGPGILKCQASASANDADGACEFDLVLERSP